MVDLAKRIREMKRSKSEEQFARDVQRTNVYICDKCRHAMVTIDRDEGTTPMFTRCEIEECGGTAASTMYRAVTLLCPTQEWYRPSDAEMKSLNPATVEHVKRGGLIRRPTQPQGGQHGE